MCGPEVIVTDAFEERRREDIRKLAELAQKSGGRLRVESDHSAALTTIDAVGAYCTSGSPDYPDAVQGKIELSISLSSNYPFKQPQLFVRSPIFHPHVYPDDSKVCIGIWLPSESLDVLVARVFSFLVYEAKYLNMSDAANPAARDWYKEAVRRVPAAFPSDRAVFDGTDKPRRRKRRVEHIGAETHDAQQTTGARRRQRDWGNAAG